MPEPSGTQVRDTGTGISPEKQESIFKPFEQVADLNRNAEGTRLGLAISQQIVQLMGSKLQVISQPGQGSTFWFDLTLPVVEVATGEQPVPIRRIIGYEGIRKTVLVVDDKEYNRRLLTDLLQMLGFAVRGAENGKLAVEQALAWHPDVILMDLVMPVKTGFEAVHEIRQLPALKGGSI